jgi:hypothetical protein
MRAAISFLHAVAAYETFSYPPPVDICIEHNLKLFA